MSSMLQDSMIGHNSEGMFIRVLVRLFNSINRRNGLDDLEREITLPVGSTVGDVLALLQIAADDVFLVLVNGRDITPGLNDKIRIGHELEDGDAIAFSGPVPYSWGYGAPVV